MAEPLVGILMGSESDLEVMKQSAQVLEAFDVPHEMRICSAHRMPEETFEYARSARGRGLRVLAQHLDDWREGERRRLRERNRDLGLTS